MVQKESGHSLKLSLSHTTVIDSGNSSILPTIGVLLKVNHEQAGYTAGDVSFLKEDFELQLNKQVVLDLVSQPLSGVECWCPLVRNHRVLPTGFTSEDPPASIDSVCTELSPRVKGTTWEERATVLVACTCTPCSLPARPGSFGEPFRTHFFLNVGNLCNLNYGEGPEPTFINWPSASTGPTEQASPSGWATSLTWSSTTASPWECCWATGYVKACSLEPGYSSYSWSFFQRSLGSQAAEVAMLHAFPGEAFVWSWVAAPLRNQPINFKDK